MKADTRGVWVWIWFEQLREDLRHAVRVLRRSPGFAAAAIVTFAIGIGANSAIFSIVDAAILRPLPYDHPGRLVTFRLLNERTGRQTDGATPRDFLDWRERSSELFERLAMIGGGAFTMNGAGEPQRLRVSRVTSGFFELMRVRPLYGRVFTEADESPGRDRVAVLSHDFWRLHFAASPDVIGRTLRLDGEPYDIVGVLPSGFAYPPGRSATPVFLPIAFSAEDRQSGVFQSMGFGALGRLRDNVDIRTAESAMSRLEAILDRNHQASHKGYTRVELTPMIERYVASARSWMLLWLGAVFCVLLIACANVANLFIAHGTTRARELTVRAALGASRWRIVRHLLAEGLLIATIGAAVGLAVAWLTLGLLRASLPASIPRASEVGLDLRVLGVTAAGAIATGLLCALFPALHGSRVDLVRGLKDESGYAVTAGRARQRVRDALAWAEVALATLLLAGAGLLTLSFARLLRVDPGFDASGVVSFGLSLPRADVEANDGRLEKTVRDVLAALRATPGLESSLIANSSGPFAGGYMTIPPRIGDQRGRERRESIGLRKISPGFLDMLRVPLRAGRYFTEQDRRGSSAVAIVNDVAVRQFWNGRNPIGQHLTIDEVAHEIVGVVGDMWYRGPATPPVAEAFVPYEQSWFSNSTLLVRPIGRGDVVAAVKAAVWSVDPSLPLTNIMTAEELFDRATVKRRFNMLLLSIFAALALVIAATGVYGVLSFLVGQRRREIGVRVALGATSASVAAIFVRRGGAIVAAGIVTGVAGAWILARGIESFLFEVEPRDPVVLGLAAGILAIVGLIASWVSARRAAQMNPLDALRAE